VERWWRVAMEMAKSCKENERVTNEGGREVEVELEGGEEREKGLS